MLLNGQFLNDYEWRQLPGANSDLEGAYIPLPSNYEASPHTLQHYFGNVPFSATVFGMGTDDGDSAG